MPWNNVNATQHFETDKSSTQERRQTGKLFNCIWPRWPNTLICHSQCLTTINSRFFRFQCVFFFEISLAAAFDKDFSVRESKRAPWRHSEAFNCNFSSLDMNWLSHSSHTWQIQLVRAYRNKNERKIQSQKKKNSQASKWVLFAFFSVRFVWRISYCIATCRAISYVWFNFVRNCRIVY